ncbi:MAG: hypothetical protein RI885_2754 [Actinomycetota bacterium]|jgi:glycosyltransferase involved in cell wall biosynthesis
MTPESRAVYPAVPDLAVPDIPVPDLWVAGPARHGVVRYALDLARTAGESGADPALIDAETALRPGRPTHLHFTDGLFGRSPELAADTIERLASIVPLSITLHDVPQSSDGAANLPRRIDCYRRVAGLATGVVCNSAHELAFLEESGVAPGGRVTGRASRRRGVAVIPLGAESPRSARRVGGDSTGTSPGGASSTDLDPIVALIGFVYPGKGHREVIDAVARVRDGGRIAVEVVAFGAASAGHEADLEALVDHAERAGVVFGSTGYLDDDELLRRCSRAAVPIAAHQHISASGSILTWLAAGRRPLVLDSRYAREMAALRPQTMTLYSPDGMDDVIAAALADPTSTRLAPTTSTAPHLVDTYAAYARWWRELTA